MLLACDNGERLQRVAGGHAPPTPDRLRFQTMEAVGTLHRRKRPAISAPIEGVVVPDQIQARRMAGCRPPLRRTLRAARGGGR